MLPRRLTAPDPGWTLEIGGRTFTHAHQSDQGDGSASRHDRDDIIISNPANRERRQASWKMRASGLPTPNSLALMAPRNHGPSIVRAISALPLLSANSG